MSCARPPGGSSLSPGPSEKPRGPDASGWFLPRRAGLYAGRALPPCLRFLHLDGPSRRGGQGGPAVRQHSRALPALTRSCVSPRRQRGGMLREAQPEDLEGCRDPHPMCALSPRLCRSGENLWARSYCSAGVRHGGPCFPPSSRGSPTHP